MVQSFKKIGEFGSANKESSVIIMFHLNFHCYLLFIFLLQEQYTYFMSNIDPRVTLVVVFDSKKDDRETSICNHITELTAQFRWNRVFANLKLNNK